MDQLPSHTSRYLRDMELVSWQKKGRQVFYTLADTHLREILVSSIAHIAHVRR